MALVGYTDQGFVVQNSWGPDWGRGGFALLPYEDFMMHATDVWVAQLGVPVTADLSGYDVVVAPLLHMVKGDLADRVTALVERGGTFVTTALSGRVDEDDNAFLADVPGPFASLLGLRVEETDAQQPDVVNPVTLFDAEAWYARDYVLGRVSLPSRQEMAADIDKWVQRESTLSDDAEMIDFQADHVAELLADVDYPKFDLDRTKAFFTSLNPSAPVEEVME